MTTLTLNETRIRAAAFAKDVSDATRKNAEPAIFGHAFFRCLSCPSAANTLESECIY